MGPCDDCGGGHKSACRATYTDGFKCFSCGKSKSFDSHRMAMMGKAAFKPVTVKSGVYIPKHTRDTREFNPATLKWLYSYYVYDKLIKKHRIGYVEDTGDWGESLLLPVIKDNEMVFVTRRFLNPKRVLGIGEKQVYKIKNGFKEVILVEDYISAIRVAEFADVYCLFGTYLNKDELPELLNNYNNITLWLDGDEAGVKGAKSILKQFNYKIKENKRRFPLRHIGNWNVRVVESAEDPKFYSPTEIKEYLNDGK